jgi:pyruvate carboxylase
MWFLSQSSSEALSQLTSLGAAGIMGAMWLWERRSSRAREEQLDEAHARILADRVQLEQLIEVVRDNTQAMTRLTASVEQWTGAIERK